MQRNPILLGAIASAWIFSVAHAQDFTKDKNRRAGTVLSVTDSVNLVCDSRAARLLQRRGT
jgi:hypothetical protein